MNTRFRFFFLSISVLALVFLANPAKAYITVTATPGATVSAKASQFYLKLYLNNPSSVVKTMSMVVDYSDNSRNLGYDMYAAGTRNPDGTNASSDKYTAITVLEKQSYRHQLMVNYTANTALQPTGNYNFVELYFNLNPNYYQAGQAINITLRNIEFYTDQGGRLDATTSIPVTIVLDSGSSSGGNTGTGNIFSLTAEPGYPISWYNTEFMGKIFIENNYAYVKNLDFDIAYESSSPLPYELYAAGTRFRYGAESNNGKYQDPLDARDRWWTFLDWPEKTAYRHRAHLRFQVGVGEAVTPQPRFNFLQLYFHTLSGYQLQKGQKIIVSISNIKVQFGDGSTKSDLPNMSFTFVVDAPLAVDDLNPLALKVWPNPASTIINLATPDNDIESIELISQNGSCSFKTLLPASSNGEQQINVSAFPPGAYILQVIKSQERTLMPIIITR
jgi:hypothetical protein